MGRLYSFVFENSIGRLLELLKINGFDFRQFKIPLFCLAFKILKIFLANLLSRLKLLRESLIEGSFLRR